MNKNNEIRAERARCAYDAAISNMARARMATNWTDSEIDLASAALCDASLTLQRLNPTWGTAYIKWYARRA